MCCGITWVLFVLRLCRRQRMKPRARRRAAPAAAPMPMPAFLPGERPSLPPAATTAGDEDDEAVEDDGIVAGEISVVGVRGTGAGVIVPEVL